MDSIKRNPFSIVKANDFTDQEILDYWVDIKGDSSFKTMLDPISPVPMIIIGGKGSGKTHLMRYFSYPIQKVRSPENVLDFIYKENFIGVYLKCGGLNSGRFTGKNINNEIWKNFFPYYFDIWMSLLLIDTIIDATEKEEIDQIIICEKITDLFDQFPFEKPKTLKDLSKKIKEIQKNLDVAVNNCIFKNTLNGIEILATPGNLFYGIPKVFSEHVKKMNGISFVYLIDELENFLEYQQIYIQSLIRDTKPPCSIKVGVRTYGIKTYKTMAGDEENIEGSEFSMLRLDKQFREKKSLSDYKDFAIRLALKRLNESELISNGRAFTEEEFINSFDNDKNMNELDENTDFSSGVNGNSIKKLKTELIKHEKKNIANGLTIGNESEEILKNLSFEKKPLLEKIAIYLFYKSWSSSKNLLNESIIINEKCISYIKNKESQPYITELTSKFKSDLLAQLRKDNSRKDNYAGIENLIKISKGFPRSFLTLLKHIYQHSLFNAETPFLKGKISITSQLEGVKQSSLWYFEDARIAGKDGAQIKSSIERLAELYRINRYSNKPSECSLTAFSVNLSSTSEETQRIIKLATDWSMLLKDTNGRKDKNSEQVHDKYILNPMLAPHWGLPISVRGVINFNQKQLNSIFDPEFLNDYESEKSEFESSRNVPFVTKKGADINNKQGSLEL